MKNGARKSRGLARKAKAMAAAAPPTETTRRRWRSAGTASSAPGSATPGVGSGGASSGVIARVSPATRISLLSKAATAARTQMNSALIERLILRALAPCSSTRSTTLSQDAVLALPEFRASNRSRSSIELMWNLQEVRAAGRGRGADGS